MPAFTALPFWVSAFQLLLGQHLKAREEEPRKERGPGLSWSLNLALSFARDDMCSC